MIGRSKDSDPGSYGLMSVRMDEKSRIMEFESDGVGVRGTIASFCMEVGLLLDEKLGIATPHAGGLGVLEGDVFLTACDIGHPYIAISLLHKNGYAGQEINEYGEQVDIYENFDTARLELRKETTSVNLDGSRKEINCYQYSPRASQSQTLLYLQVNDMDTRLYQGDKLAKSTLLGIGGVRILKELGYDLRGLHFKLNESNTGLALIELLRLFENEKAVKDHSSFVTHTALPHGHDAYDLETLRKRLRDDPIGHFLSSAEFDKFSHEGKVNLSNLANSLSGKTFAVSEQHKRIAAQHTFVNNSIDHVTNGVHWSHISARKQEILDKYLAGWKTSPELLRGATRIPVEEFQAVHQQDKADLIEYLKRESGIELAIDRPISAVLRRQTAYKRSLYLFSEIERLKDLVTRYGLQHIQGGKAHPEDATGKREIREYHRLMETLHNYMQLVFIKNYGLGKHKIFLNGIDFLIYSPIEDQEACGTSYMKTMWAGVPVLGSLAGGLPEVCIDGVNSFIFKTQKEFYDKLELILEEYERNRLAQIRMNAVASGAYVSSCRMFREFLLKISKKGLNGISLLSSIA